MHLNSRTLILTFLFVLLLLASHASAPAMLAATAVQDEAIPAERLLNADGTLNLNTGYSGSVDLANWRVDLDPQRGPVLAPKVAGSWNALGTGLNSGAFAIAISGSNVYVGGQFTDAGSNPNADYIALWNGSAWSALGSTPLNDWVEVIAISGSNVYVGGRFTDAGGNPNADHIALWNGSTWSALGTTPLNANVKAIAVSGSNVYVGGFFENAGGDANADFIALWNGSARRH